MSSRPSKSVHIILELVPGIYPSFILSVLIEHPQFVSFWARFMPCLDLCLRFVVCKWYNHKKAFIHSRFCHGAHEQAILDSGHLVFSFDPNYSRHRFLPMLPRENMGGCDAFFVAPGACNRTPVGILCGKIWMFEVLSLY